MCQVKRIRNASVMLLLVTLGMGWLSAESNLYFPRLTNQSGTLLGVTFVNPGSQDAQLELVAYNSNGLLVSGPGVTNPAQVMVPAQQQVGLLATQIFGEGLAPNTVGWFRASSVADGITGFYLFLDEAGSFLDGADLPEAEKRIVFNTVEVGAGTSTELNIINTQDIPAAEIDLLLIDEAAVNDNDPNNDVLQTTLLNVPARAVRRIDVAEQFGLNQIGPSAYLLALSDTRIVGFQVVREEGRDVIGLNAKSARERLNRLYFPQLAVLGPWQMEIGLVNRALYDVTAVFTAYQPNGQPYSAPQVSQNRVVRQIPAELPFRANVEELFGFSGNDALDGWIEVVSTNGVALNGFVSYGTPQGGSQAAVAVQVEPQTRALVSHIATTLGFFTGVAALNPASEAASYRILAATARGQVLGRFDGVLQPGERVSRLIEQFIPEAAGQAGGIIWIRSSSPLYLTALFGKVDGRVLSNIPTQDVPDSYLPDAGLPRLSIDPGFVVLAPSDGRQFSAVAENGPIQPVWTVVGNGTGTVNANGLYSAPAAALDTPVILTAEDNTQGLIGAATLDVLAREGFSPSLTDVEAMAYSVVDDRIYAIRPTVIPAGAAGPRGTASSTIWEITSTGASELAEVIGARIRALLPYVASDGIVCLLLGTADQVIRLDLGSFETRVIADNFFDLTGMAWDSVRGNILVVDAAGLTLVSGTNIEADRLSNLEQNGSPAIRVFNRAALSDITFDPCSGDFLLSDSAAGQVLQFRLLDRTVQTVAQNINGAEHLLLLQRSRQTCGQASHLLVGSNSGNRVRLLRLNDGSLQDWPGVNRATAMAFVPETSALTNSETVVISERVDLALAGGFGGGLVAVAVDSRYRADPVNPRAAALVGVQSDPVGDTFEIAGPVLDILEFSLQQTDTELLVSVSLIDPFVPCIDPCPEPPGSPGNAAFGFIDLDLDQNPATGGVSFVDLQSPHTTGMGVEFCLDLTSYDPETETILAYRVIGNDGELAGAVFMDVFENTAQIHVPLDLLGDDGLVNAAIILGNPLEPTDAAPNGGSVSSLPASAGN